MNNAIIFGRFCPLHNAHLTLIRATQNLTKKLHFGLFVHENDPVPSPLRIKWLSRFGEVHIIKILDIKKPYESIELRALPKVDLVAGSNPKIVALAQALSAKYFMWDPAREAMPINSTQVLKDIPKHWNDLPDFVRIHAQKRLSFVGPESVGKSFFAKRMAAVYGGPHVPEYGRPYEKYREKGDYSSAELVVLAQGHASARSAIAMQAGPVLFEDTEELMTAVWSEMLLGHSTDEVEALITLPKLYVLYGADTPWEEDSLRYFAKKELRQDFFDRIERKLIKHKARYEIIDGDWQAREAETIAIVEAWLKAPFKFS